MVSLGFSRSFSLVSPKKWNNFTKMLVIFISGNFVNNTANFMMNQVDIKTVKQGMTFPDLFDKFDIMLKAILAASVVLVFLIITEALFTKVFKVTQ